ncbi:MAG: carbohydrate binding domain-containing protein [Clostridia bacterium]|nr:carbohydrate binding domain-containing protein [Clostridia bacterium]
MTRKKRILATLLACLFICSMPLFAYAADSAGDNLFPNPTFEGTGESIEGWTLPEGGVSVETDPTAPFTGNAVTILNHADRLVSQNILINAEGKLFISFWYKSEADSDARIYYNEKTENGESLGDYKKDLPSSGGKWKLYRETFVKKDPDANSVVIIFRNMSGTANTREISIASPYCSATIPELYIYNGSFEEDEGNWKPYASSAGSFDEKAQDGENHYLKVTGSTADSRYYLEQTSQALENGKTYKISFKYMPISEGAVPKVNVVLSYTNGVEMDTNVSFDGNNFQTRVATALGTPATGVWTEYVGYLKISGSRDRNGVHYEANAVKIRAFALQNQINGYDDFKIEAEKEEIILAQNGVEITDFTADNATILYHKTGDSAAEAPVTLYFAQYDDERLIHIQVIKGTTNATGVFTINSLPVVAAAQKIKVFRWDGLSPLSAYKSASKVVE